MKKNSELSKFTPEELMDELKSRSKGFVMGLELKGRRQEFITSLTPEHILGTVGLHRILKERIDIYLHDTQRGFEENV